jgi:hypothetical protein
MGVGLQGTSLLVSHHKGACVGLWFWQKHAGRERQEELKRKKKQKLQSSPAARPWEEGGTMSLKMTLFCSLLFFF